MEMCVEISNFMATFLIMNFAHSWTFIYSRKCDLSWGTELLRKPTGNIIFKRHLHHFPVIGNNHFFPVMLKRVCWDN